MQTRWLNEVKSHDWRWDDKMLIRGTSLGSEECNWCFVVNTMVAAKLQVSVGSQAAGKKRIAKETVRARRQGLHSGSPVMACF